MIERRLRVLAVAMRGFSLIVGVPDPELTSTDLASQRRWNDPAAPAGMPG